MRVYELARIRGVSAADLITQLRADGEWVASHLSVMPTPVLSRYLPPSHSVAATAPPRRSVSESRTSLPSLPPARVPFPPRPKPRRRPGPRPITMQRAARWDDYDDPIADLRYEPELTTRDVADFFRVQQATVRQWVARGYLTPIRREGPSNIFRTSEVLDAFDLIEPRRKAAGEAPRSRSFFATTIAANRVEPKHYDRIVTIHDAAKLVGVNPATIRTWMRRGYLTPTSDSKPRAVRLRIRNVIDAARGRRLPQVVPSWQRQRR